MGLREIESALPPGFRFHPSDEELVCHYLYKKVAGEWPLEGTMVEVDLHTQEPWELPDVAKLSAKEWYFFSFRDRKYATGLRTNRATKSGYWKATGKDRTICDPMSRCTVGMRKTLVFYRGRAPNGMKTDWVMHEFRLESSHSPPKEDWVLCRVFHKSKGENTDQDNTTTTAAAGGSSFPTLRSPTPPGDQQLMPDECCQVQMDTSNLTCTVGPPTEKDNSAMNPFLNLAQLLQCNFLDLPPAQDMSGTVPAVMMGMSPRGGSTDQQDGSFGFFMNCGFEAEDHDMGEAGLMASLGGGRHQGGHHNFYF